MENMENSEDSNDSDRELQIAFASGLIKPGLNVQQVKVAKPTPINNVAGLRECFHTLQQIDKPWVERLDLTCAPATPPQPLGDTLGEEPDNLEGEEVHNDFKREMYFYRLAQAAVLEGLPRLQSLKIPTKRPTDFMAEMAKSDNHMKKVREKLLSKQQAAERSEKAKKLRELKKYGKKVQQEVLLKRQKEKREMLDAVKKYRKGQTDKLDFLNEDEKRRNNSQKINNKKPNKKRMLRNQKFGFGGQKKRSKYNTAESAGEVAGYGGRNIPHGQKGKKMVNKNRPGKQRRQQQKSKAASHKR